MQDQRELEVATPEGSIFVPELPGGDPTFILMHGFPDDHRIYGKLMPSLPPRRAVAFDWLGYGQLHVLPGATHYPQHDQLEVVAELLQRALA